MRNDEMAQEDLPALPPKFQIRFERVFAQAELEYIKNSSVLYNFPGLTGVAQFQKVFFAFCEEARNACREREWTVTETRRAVRLAWPTLLAHLSPRKFSDTEAREFFACAIRSDAKWQEHQEEMKELAIDAGNFETASASNAAGNGSPRDSPNRSPSQIERPALKKRGRPSRFTPAQLATAKNMKEAGKRNNEIAKLLYQTQSPTPEQR